MTAPFPATTRLALLSLLAQSPVTAQSTHVWSGGAVPLGDRGWSNPGNWVGGVPPKNFNTADVILTGSYGSSPSISSVAPIVDEPWSVRSLKLDSLVVVGAEMELTGEPLTLGPGGMHFSGSNIDIHNDIRIRRDQTWLDDDGFTRTVRFVNDLEFLVPEIVAPYTVTIAGSHTNLEFPGNITGEGTFRLTGDVTAVIGAPGTTRSAPQLDFLIEDDAELIIEEANYTLGGLRPSGTGSVIVGYEQSILNVNSLQGDGRVFFTNRGGAAAMSTLRHQGSASETFQGSLTGASAPSTQPDYPCKGRLIKSGSANLTFNRAGSAGDLLHLDLTGGKLILDNSTGLVSHLLTGSATLETRPGSTFALTGTETSTFGGWITGGGGLTIGEGHTLTLEASAAPHELGVTAVNGSLTLAGSTLHTGRLTGSGTSTLGSFSELRITAAASTGFAGHLTHNGTTSDPNGLLVVQNPITFSLNATAKQHSFASLAMADGATLRVANGSELLVRSYTGNGSTLQLTGNSTAFLVENPSFGFPMKIDAADGNVTIPIGPRFQLAAAGKSHQIGHLDISNRGLDLRGGSSLTLGKLSGSIALSIDSGTTLALADFHDSPFTGAFINGADGGGSLQLTSAGTKILRAGGFTGTTTLGGTAGAIYQTLPGTAPIGPVTLVSGAKLEAANINNSSLDISGTLELRSLPSPDGPVHGGCATATFTQRAGSRTIITINDRPNRPLGFGKVVASGAISLDSSAVLEVNLNNNFGAKPGDTWTLFSTTGGNFSQVNLPANRIVNATNLPPGTRLTWLKTASTLELRLESIVSDPPGYYTWATANNLTPANRGPLLDPDNDLIPNWREYLLGLDPLAAGAPSAPDHELRLEAGEPVARFRISPAADFAADFEVEGSADLGITDPWSSTKATFLGSGTLPDTFLYRDYRFHLPATTAPRGFLRIRYKGLTSHPDD